MAKGEVSFFISVITGAILLDNSSDFNFFGARSYHVIKR